MDQNIVVGKLNSIIEAGKHKAARGMAALEQEYQIRRDFIVQPDTIDINVDKTGIHPILTGVGQLDLTKHSRGQFLTRAGVPVAFADKLIDLEVADLLRNNLHTLLPKVSAEGVMFRVVNGLAKGVLSSSYKKIDASPIFEAFVAGAMKHGMVPHEGLVTDTRAFLSFLLPEIIEIMPGEHVVVGMELRTSDYGRGAVELCMSILRLLCQNGMVGFDIMRKIHVGRRFQASEFDEAGPVIDISARTLELDTATVKSALNDVMTGIPNYTKLLTEGVRAQAAGEIDLPSAMAALRKKGLKKATVENIKTLYESPLPVELVPENPGKWRFANVISMLANKAEGDESKDLQDVAWASLMPS